MVHLYTIFIKEIWQDPILKICIESCQKLYLIKNYFRLNRKNFQFSLIRNHDFNLITQRTVRHGQDC